MNTISCFATTVYKDELTHEKKQLQKLNRNLLSEIQTLSQDDRAGINWSKKNYTNGFTSYATANQMHQFSPTFAELEALIRKHVLKLVKQLKLNVQKNELKMTTCWVNIMGPQCTHTMHIHPSSIISGTYYLQMPKNASALRFEDPRYNHFMSRPAVQIHAPEKFQTHFSIPAKPGDVILFESWLKHEVPMNTSKEPRISISFNY